jgi:hypothetical protein
VNQRPADEANFERTAKLGRGDQGVAEARRFAELAVSSCDAACREAIALAASELAENAVKYGVQETDSGAGSLSVGIRANVARLSVTNKVANAADARNVLAIVRRVSAPDAKPAELYRARLQTLFSTPRASRAELGLLRLVFEGGFRLTASFDFDAQLLQIVAERPCRRA